MRESSGPDIVACMTMAGERGTDEGSGRLSWLTIDQFLGFAFCGQHRGYLDLISFSLIHPCWLRIELTSTNDMITSLCVIRIL